MMAWLSPPGWADKTKRETSAPFRAGTGWFGFEQMDSFRLARVALIEIVCQRSWAKIVVMNTEMGRSP
jgi:hypothetical protein